MSWLNNEVDRTKKLKVQIEQLDCVAVDFAWRRFQVVRKESQLLILYCPKFICLLGVVTGVDVLIDEVLLDDLAINEKGWRIVMLP